MTFKSKLIVGLAAALVILIAVGVLSYRRVLRENADVAWVSHTNRVIDTLDAVLADLLNAETGQRGFLLTGENSYLAPYNSALERLNSDFDLARKLTADDPVQQRRLERMKSLIAAKLAELKGTIDLRESRGLIASAKSVQTGVGKQDMDQIRTLIARMKEEEEQLLQQRLEAALSASRQMKYVILAGNFLGFLFLAGAGLLIYQEMTKRADAEAKLHRSEERFRLMVANVKDYAIFQLDPEGRVLTWNAGAERLTGYRDEEMIGQHFSCLCTAEDRTANLPAKHLANAVREGYNQIEGWRVRKDGSLLWASVVITALRDETGKLQGFSKVVRDLTERRRIEEEIRLRNTQLEAANKELETFCYSVSHDLRAPLRSIDGFSQALLEDQAARLDDSGNAYLRRIRAATQRMGELIDDLLNLSRVTRAEIVPKTTNLSEMALSIADELRRQEPDRKVEFAVAPGLSVNADPRLMRIVLENLLGNAWKFTSKRERACIEFGRTQQNGSSAFFVRDNGAGFDPAYSNRLFGPFQRLHSVTEFPGTGIGLATVQRIVLRHGGRVWAEGAVDQGATVYLQL